MQKRGREYGSPPVVGVGRQEAEGHLSTPCLACQMDEERRNFRWSVEQTVCPYACESVVREERRIESVSKCRLL